MSVWPNVLNAWCQKSKKKSKKSNLHSLSEINSVTLFFRRRERFPVRKCALGSRGGARSPCGTPGALGSNGGTFYHHRVCVRGGRTFLHHTKQPPTPLADLPLDVPPRLRHELLVTTFHCTAPLGSRFERGPQVIGGAGGSLTRFYTSDHRRLRCATRPSSCQW